MKPRHQRHQPKTERRDETVLGPRPTSQQVIRFMLANGFKSVKTQSGSTAYSNGTVTFFKDYTKEGFTLISGPAEKRQVSFNELLEKAGLDE